MIRTRLVKHSIRAMARYRLRSAVMMLGSLVGVATLTLVVSVGDGARQKVLATVRQLFGSSSIMIFARGTELMGGPRPDAARLTLDDIDAVSKEVPEVETWDPQQALPSASIRRGELSVMARVLGASERSERVWGRTVTRGAYFDAAADRAAARVALIGPTVAARLFKGEDPLDAEILVGSVPVRVVGVLEALGTDVHGMDRDNEVVVPISTMMRRVMNVDTIALAKVLVTDPARAANAAAEIRRVLRERHKIAAGQPDDFTLLTPVEVQRMVGRVERVLTLYLPLVGGVVLLVGGLVAATLMLASVSSRVSEIGLRRAVGASAADIGLQFLLETAATVVSGGLGGLLVGYVGARIVASRFHIGEVFSWKAVLVGVAVSVAAGLLAGVAPARRAAAMRPADALR
jgi:putative ABC transport system permease protein